MYRYILYDSSTSCEGYLESFFRFSYLPVKELIKGLSPNYAIFSTFS